MNLHQKQSNAYHYVYGRFQKAWTGGATALEAFEKAKKLAVRSLNEEVIALNATTFEGMCLKGLIAKGVTGACRRGER
tara:strand:- start:859 stop:1092 length:234 start_codon:yes stop_codon:yes gene_type:complete